MAKLLENPFEHFVRRALILPIPNSSVRSDGRGSLGWVCFSRPYMREIQNYICEKSKTFFYKLGTIFAGNLISNLLS